MTRARLFPLLLALGCFGSEEPAPEPPQSETVYLIWQQTPDGFATSWMDADGTVQSEHDGLVMAWEDKAWSLRLKDAPHRVLDCTCAMAQEDPFASDEPPPECMVDGTLQTATMYRSDDMMRHLNAIDAGDAWESDQVRGMEVRGTFGPYLLGATHFASYPCGAAHGSATSRFFVLNLAKPRDDLKYLPAYLSLETLQETTPALIEDAQHALMAASESADANPALELTALSVLWTDAGPTMQAQFTMSACYACGDGQWGDATVSHQVALPSIPSSFMTDRKVMAWQTVPAPVAAWVQTAAPEAQWGFSVLTDVPTALATTRASLPLRSSTAVSDDAR